MRINTNILSLSAQRNLGNTTRALSRAMERLASGLRINSARDDAAGMAIGSGLDSQRRGMIQAIRNINDARGFLNTAEGAMASQSDLVQRMRELSIQSANGTLSDDDREYLNAELQQLLEEFNRITRQTEFNGVNLLDGSFVTRGLQVGTTKGSTIDFSISSMAANAVFTQRLTVGDGTFQTRTTIAAGTSPYAVTAADLNGDGKIDLMTSDSGSNTVSIALGNGDGTFRSRTTIATGTAPRPVNAVDVNGDGKLDLVVGDSTDATISIFLGLGDGTFQARTTLSNGAGYSSLEPTDVNGDGRLDLISWGSSEFSVTLGNGNGTFQSRVTFSSGHATASKFVIGDISNDGKLDVLTSYFFSSTVNISLGNGDGTFQAATTIGSATTLSSLVLADVNADGNLDLLSTGQFLSSIQIALGNGNGSFQAYSTISTASNPYSMIVRDVNGDGQLDLITGHADGSFQLALGNGDGTFQSRNTIGTGFGTNIQSILSADINDDGVLDLLSTDSSNAAVGMIIANTQVITTNPAVSIATQEAASDMLQVFDNALSYINSARASIGATTSRLDFAQAVSESLVENLSFAKSQIMDADISAEVAEFSRLQILQQAGLAVLSQANMSSRLTLKLLENI